MKMTKKQAAEQLDTLLCATVMRIEHDRKELRRKNRLTDAQRVKKELLPLQIKNAEALWIAIRDLRKEHKKGNDHGKA